MAAFDVTLPTSTSTLTMDPFMAFGAFPEPVLPATPAPTGPNVQDFSSVSDKTLFLKVRFGVLGNTRKVSGSEVLETDADKALLSVTKTLLDSKELSEIRRRDMQMRKWLENMCLPYDIGLSLLPIGLVEAVDAKLEQYKAERAELVSAFVAVYPGLCAKAAESLKSLYHAGNYPPVEEVSARFTFGWDYISFGVPGTLADISPALFAAQKDKLEKQFEEARTEITAVMRQTLAELVSHLAERLTPTDDGKAKRLHETAVTNLKDFLDTFDLRNITNDGELAEQVTKARALITGVSVEGLRKSEEWKSKILSGMQGIQESLSGLVEEKGIRKFREDE